MKLEVKRCNGIGSVVCPRKLNNLPNGTNEKRAIVDPEKECSFCDFSRLSDWEYVLCGWSPLKEKIKNKEVII